jgi:hypothetical protein
MCKISDIILKLYYILYIFIYLLILGFGLNLKILVKKTRSNLIILDSVHSIKQSINTNVIGTKSQQEKYEISVMTECWV